MKRNFEVSPAFMWYGFETSTLAYLERSAHDDVTDLARCNPNHWILSSGFETDTTSETWKTCLETVIAPLAPPLRWHVRDAFALVRWWLEVVLFLFLCLSEVLLIVWVFFLFQWNSWRRYIHASWCFLDVSIVIRLRLKNNVNHSFFIQSSLFQCI